MGSPLKFLIEWTAEKQNQTRRLHGANSQPLSAHTKIRMRSMEFAG